MNIKYLAALTALISNSVFAGQLFDVQSTQEGLNIPLIVCADAVHQLTCQNYTVQGKLISIRSKTMKPSYPNSGLKVEVPGYTLSGCTPYGNGYCTFVMSNSSYSNITLG